MEIQMATIDNGDPQYSSVNHVRYALLATRHICGHVSLKEERFTCTSYWHVPKISIEEKETIFSEMTIIDVSPESHHLLCLSINLWTLIYPSVSLSPSSYCQFPLFSLSEITSMSSGWNIWTTVKRLDPGQGFWRRPCRTRFRAAVIVTSRSGLIALNSWPVRPCEVTSH